MLNFTYRNLAICSTGNERSQYEHYNTFKAFVGVSPSGAFTFLSRLFSGSISDWRIVKDKGFLDKLEYGDGVMADTDS